MSEPEAEDRDDAVEAAIDVDVAAATLGRSLIALGRYQRMCRDALAGPDELGKANPVTDKTDEAVNWSIQVAAGAARKIAKRLEKLLTEGA